MLGQDIPVKVPNRVQQRSDSRRGVADISVSKRSAYLLTGAPGQ